MVTKLQQSISLQKMKINIVPQYEKYLDALDKEELYNNWKML